MRRRIDAATLLERALVAHAAAAGAGIAIDGQASTRWASATFVGARHRMTVVSEEDACRVWLAGLADADLPLRGHLVADVVIVEQAWQDERVTATIEVLTVEEA